MAIFLGKDSQGRKNTSICVPPSVNTKIQNIVYPASFFQSFFPVLQNSVKVLDLYIYLDMSAILCIRYIVIMRIQSLRYFVNPSTGWEVGEGVHNVDNKLERLQNIVKYLTIPPPSIPLRNIVYGIL